MKSICKYCHFFCVEGKCVAYHPNRLCKPDKRSCKAYQPRTMLEADTDFLVICYVRYCMSRHSYAPSECDMFIHEHIKDPGVQAAIPFLVQDMTWHIDAEEKDTSGYKDPFLQLWRDLLAFIEKNQKGDAK